MSTALARPPPATTFKPGAVALRFRRGHAHYLVPRAWVRSVIALHGIVPLPRTHPWVVGVAVHDNRPVPVLDVAQRSGTSGTYPVGVLLGTPDQAIFAFIVADGVGRFASVPGSARIDAGSGWLRKIQGCAQPMWWIEAGALASELKG